MRRQDKKNRSLPAATAVAPRAVGGGPSAPSWPTASVCRWVIAVATLLVLGQVCIHEFNSMDDDFTLYDNPTFNPPTISKVLSSWNPRNAEHSLWIPVTYTVWGVLASMAWMDRPDDLGLHLNPWIFHSASVLFHVVTALIVFDTLRRLFRRDRAACLGALLFALHPTQVESVAWASGGKDLLCGLFAMLAINLHVRGVAADTPPATRRLFHRLGVLSYVAGMLSKPTAMVTPAIVLVLDLWVIRRPWKTVLRSVWPWFALAIPCMIWTKLIQPAEHIHRPPLWARPLIVADSLSFYLYQLLLPLESTMDWGRSPAFVIDSGAIYRNWVAPVLIALAVLLIRKRHPAILAGAAAFVVGMLPVSGIVPFHFQGFSTVADHYMYIPMFGIAVVAAYLLARIDLAPAYVTAALLIAVMSVRTFNAASVWRDDRTAYLNAVAVRPRSLLANNNLGRDYFREARRLHESGRVAEGNESLRMAEEHYRRCVQIDDDCLMAHDNLALLLWQTGRTDEAVVHAKEAIRIDSMFQKPADLAGRYFYLAALLDSAGHHDEAIRHAELARRYNPGLATIEDGLAAMRRHREEKKAGASPPLPADAPPPPPLPAVSPPRIATPSHSP
jgi:hypothetical protein